MDGAEGIAEGVDLPETSSGQAAREVLEILNAEEDSTAADWEDRLADPFLEQVSPEELAEILNAQFRPVRPWTAVDHEDAEDSSVTLLEASEGQELQMQLALDEDG